LRTEKLEERRDACFGNLDIKFAAAGCWVVVEPALYIVEFKGLQLSRPQLHGI
jgi:hypothetical protein